MTKEIKVALFVITIAVIFILGMNFLKGKGVFDNNNTYYTIFDKVDGLYTSDPVVVNGFAVGKMGALELISSGPNRGKVLAEMIVREDVQIPAGSKATLFSADLLGEMNVKLVYNEKATTFYQDGDTVLTMIEGSMFESLGAELTPLTDKLDVTLGNINQLFDFENANQQTLNYTLESLNKVLDTYNTTGNVLNKRLDSQLASVEALLKNVESLTATLNNNEQNIDEILTNFNTLSASLSKLDLETTLGNVDNTLGSLQTTIAKFDDPNNTVGAVLSDRTIYDNLEKSTESLNVLLNDVRINPKRYINISVFGGNKKKNQLEPITADDLD